MMEMMFAGNPLISLFLARFFGLFLVIIAFALLINRKRFPDVARSFVENPALLVFSGFLTLVLGLLAVLVHNVWVADWRVIITILAWLTLFKGIVRLWFPDMVRGFASRVNDSWALYSALFSLFVGAYLLYQGFLIY